LIVILNFHSLQGVFIYSSLLNFALNKYKLEYKSRNFL
jgi:hypothetical protein